MIETAKLFTKEHGFDLVIGHSTKKHGEFARLWLVCELAGEYRNRHHLQPEDRKRKRESRKTNCPFKLLGSKKRHENFWLLSVKDGTHNHGPISKAHDDGVSDAEFPDLEEALFNWHQEAQAQNKDNPVHGNTLKAKALEIWHSMPQYRSLPPPDFGGEWVKAYRRRHGFPVKILTKSQHPTPSTPTAMTSANAQRLIDATQGASAPISPLPILDPALGNVQFPAAIVQILQSLHSDAQSLITSISTHVQQEMRYHDASHDFTHVLRVLTLSVKIMTSELTANPKLAYDPAAIILAALLHDLADRKYVAPGTDVENLIAGVLLDRGCDDHLALKVQMIARHVAYSTEQQNPRMVRAVISQHPELAVVQDADRLDAIGAIGIGRTFTFGGARTGTPGRESGRGMDETIRHFGEKLERLGDLMKVCFSPLFSYIAIHPRVGLTSHESGRREMLIMM
jgi:HD superfamily phosphodiesterase